MGRTAGMARTAFESRDWVEQGTAGADGSGVAWLDGKGNADEVRSCMAWSGPERVGGVWCGRRGESWLVMGGGERIGEVCHGRTGTVGVARIGAVGTEWQERLGSWASASCGADGFSKAGMVSRGSLGIAGRVTQWSGLRRRGVVWHGSAGMDWWVRRGSLGMVGSGMVMAERRGNAVEDWRGADWLRADCLGMAAKVTAVEVSHVATRMDWRDDDGKGKAGSTTQTKSPCSNTGRKQLTNQT